MACRQDLILKIEYADGNTLVEDAHGSRIIGFADQGGKVQVAGFAPISRGLAEGKMEITPGELLRGSPLCSHCHQHGKLQSV